MLFNPDLDFGSPISGDTANAGSFLDITPGKGVRMVTAVVGGVDQGYSSMTFPGYLKIDGAGIATNAAFVLSPGCTATFTGVISMNGGTVSVASDDGNYGPGTLMLAASSTNSLTFTFTGNSLIEGGGSVDDGWATAGQFVLGRGTGTAATERVFSVLSASVCELIWAAW